MSIKYKQIYVACPAYGKTGGTELLHQLVFELNQNHINATITYYNSLEYKENSYTPEDFKKYVSHWSLLSDLADSEDNLIVFPEEGARYLKRFPKSQKIFWWLSVDNYLKRFKLKTLVGSRRNKIAGLINFLNIYKREQEGLAKIRKQTVLELVQSEYARNFLKGHGSTRIEYLSDYISKEYLELKKENYSKQNIVAYNPKKGFDFTKRLMTAHPDIQWTAIENLTTEGVRDLLLRSKVYIDFGNHPGKDRIPREAAMAGCCVITDKRGSAAFHEDVPIPDEYKFEDIEVNIPSIYNQIKYCLENYPSAYQRFEGYRVFIKGEKARFNEDVKRIFKNERESSIR